MSRLLIQTLAHCDVVINHEGAPINKRWTPEYKQEETFNNRIVVTHHRRPCAECRQDETEGGDFGFPP